MYVLFYIFTLFFFFWICIIYFYFYVCFILLFIKNFIFLKCFYLFLCGLSSERKWHHTADYTKVDIAVYKWYCLAKQWCVPVSVPLLQEEALQIAKKIDPNTTFKLVVDSFKKRNNIKLMTISGKCAVVPEKNITGWHEKKMAIRHKMSVTHL